MLALEESSDGIYQAGSYYEYMKSVIENSLNNFLADTTFPYDASSSNNKGGGPGGDFGGRGGRMKSDCALSTEMNLALALENTEGVKDVDFETVWGAGHTEAERTGDSTTNFIEWVNECVKK